MVVVVVALLCASLIDLLVALMFGWLVGRLVGWLFLVYCLVPMFDSWLLVFAVEW